MTDAKVKIKKNQLGLTDKNAIFIVHDNTVAALKKVGQEAEMLGYIDPKDFMDQFTASDLKKFETPFLGTGVLSYKLFQGRGEGLTHKIVFYLPPGPVDITYNNKEYTLNLPYKIFSASINENNGKFKMAGLMAFLSILPPNSEKIPLYAMTVPNTDSGGGVCTGGVKRAEGTSLKAVKDKAIEDYFKGNGNDDYTIMIRGMTNRFDNEATLNKLVKLDIEGTNALLQPADSYHGTLKTLL